MPNYSYFLIIIPSGTLEIKYTIIFSYNATSEVIYFQQSILNQFVGGAYMIYDTSDANQNKMTGKYMTFYDAAGNVLFELAATSI